MDRDALRQLPPVGMVLEHELLKPCLNRQGRAAVLRAVRSTIADARAAIGEGTAVAVDPESLARQSRQLLESQRAHLRPVINATGILLHTGLGRRRWRTKPSRP